MDLGGLLSNFVFPPPLFYTTVVFSSCCTSCLFTFFPSISAAFFLNPFGCIKGGVVARRRDSILVYRQVTWGA